MFPTQLKNIRHVAKAGFSLLELLIYMGILTLMSVVLTASFLSLTKGRAQSESRSEVNSNLRFAFEHINQDIMNASLVTTPTLGTPASTLQLTVSGHSILYSVSSGQLQRTQDANPPERITSTAVATDVPVFTRIENYNPVLAATTTSIQIAITMRYNSTSPDWTYAASMRGTASTR